jgi:hypothetical protein
MMLGQHYSWQRQHHRGSAGGPGGLYDDSPAVLQLDADSFPAAGSGWLYLVSAMLCLTLHAQHLECVVRGRK